MASYDYLWPVMANYDHFDYLLLALNKKNGNTLYPRLALSCLSIPHLFLLHISYNLYRKRADMKIDYLVIKH